MKHNLNKVFHWYATRQKYSRRVSKEKSTETEKSTCGARPLPNQGFLDSKFCTTTTSNSSWVNQCRLLFLPVNNDRWRISDCICESITILPEFCPPRCLVLAQDLLVSECPGISRYQKIPPTDPVVRLKTLFDDAFVAFCHLKEKKNNHG